MGVRRFAGDLRRPTSTALLAVIAVTLPSQLRADARSVRVRRADGRPALAPMNSTVVCTADPRGLLRRSGLRSPSPEGASGKPLSDSRGARRAFGWTETAEILSTRRTRARRCSSMPPRRQQRSREALRTTDRPHRTQRRPRLARVRTAAREPPSLQRAERSIQRSSSHASRRAASPLNSLWFEL